MNYKIRKAQNQDLEKILELGRKIVDKYERTHLGDEVADCYINSGACDNDFRELYDNITLLTLDEDIIGLIICEKNEIQGFLVDIPYWGTGAAQVLLDYAIKNIFSDYDDITLECFVSSPRANAFYKKMGFLRQSVVDGDGGNRVVYNKSI
jgi:N-acetylglutamate synthase-like GNAT family acetyltransferase